MNRYDEMSKAHFDMTASTYDSGIEGRIASGLYKRVLQEMDGVGCRSVLDVGCGTGTILSRLSLMDGDIALHGIDLSPEMARIARERLRGKAEIRLCNICSEQLPYDDNSFDRLICMSTFHHLPNPEKVLCEMHRVVKPEGGIIIADITSFFPVRQCWNLLYSVSRSVPVFKFGDYRMYSQDEFRRLLEACRFKSVRWEKVPNIAPIYVGLVGFVATATPSKHASISAS